MTDSNRNPDILIPSRRFSRRTLAGAAAFAPLAGLGLAGIARAQDSSPNPSPSGGSTITSTGGSDQPTTGGMRPGPDGQRPLSASGAGVVPTAMTADKFSIDAEVYAADIVNGAMADPTGPYVVAWYQELAKLGQNGNVVVAGHVDYWSVGEAVFWKLWQPGAKSGDEIIMTGEDGSKHHYAVATSRAYDNGSLTNDIIQKQIAGPTTIPVLTIITCGGTFNAVTGEYDHRIVVRCNRTKVEPATA